jgi:hypothetical protein
MFVPLPGKSDLIRPDGHEERSGNDVRILYGAK